MSRSEISAKNGICFNRTLFNGQSFLEPEWALSQ